MFVQTCIKGVNRITAAEAQAILDGRGLACNWWREARQIGSADIAKRLTADEVSLHVNAYDEKHPGRTGFVHEETPFISLTAGSVERRTFLQQNQIYSAHEIALNFASSFGRWRGPCFLFYCWVVVGLRPSPEVRQLAEEVRELHTYRTYSAYQLEGEILAKIEVPACQIERYEQYEIIEEPDGTLKMPQTGFMINKHYISPDRVTNFRDCI
jgi:hypothetical protein